MKVTKIFHKKHFLISTIVTSLLVVSLLSFVQMVKASFGSWGDSSLIHACENERGGVVLVAPNGSCLSHETQVTWLKDINAASGLTITRSSSGATLALDPTNMPVTTARYEEEGTSLSNPNGSWQDIPSSTITETFKAGKIKAVFNGSLTMTNGDGTAYIRFKVQPTGGSASYVGSNTVFRSSSPSLAENSTTPLILQKLITVSAGEYSITPQVNINKSDWGVHNENSLIVEQ